MGFRGYFYLILLCPIVAFVTSISWPNKNDKKLSNHKKYDGGDLSRHEIKQETNDPKNKSKTRKPCKYIKPDRLNCFCKTISHVNLNYQFVLMKCNHERDLNSRRKFE